MVRLALCLLTAAVAAAVAAPAAAATADGPAIPSGWVEDMRASGDLTGDGQPETVLIIRATDPARVIANDGLGADSLDTNPRRLLVFEKAADGFRQIAAGDHVVPPSGSEDTPCLVDPLEDGGLSVSRRVLSLNLRFWTSCGSWGTSGNTYKFRLEGNRFRLIGFDRTEFMRNTGRGEQVSVNFLTLRKKTSPYSIESDAPGKARWSSIEPQRYYLDSLDIGECPQIDRETYLC
ncbi:hypothetical protein [Tsuneonella suprasediminis]|uniref:hypothetical protein n=1 Tax=Tsuneonella suprasediminis TaxID=2306996 RepID=UPI002F932A42